MTDTASFAQLVSLACHDLRTPLASVLGFARTLPRVATLDERTARYVSMMEEGVVEMAEVLDDLALVARIEAGRYEPLLRDADTLVLAHAGADKVEGGRASAGGSGDRVVVDSEATERALAALAECALRHGKSDRIELTASGIEVRIGPIAANVAPTVVGADLRDFGAAVARRVVAALGGALELDAETLVVRLPPAGKAAI